MYLFFGILLPILALLDAMCVGFYFSNRKYGIGVAYVLLSLFVLGIGVWNLYMAFTPR